MTTVAQDLELLSANANKLKSASVLCVGDLMLDRFSYGEVSRISPEGPVPVLRIDRQQSMLGGAGNAVRNLTALGAEVRIVSAVGDDSAGDTVLSLLSQCPIRDVSVEREAARLTTIKTRFIAQGQQLMRVDSETNRPLEETTISKLIERFSSYLDRCSVVLLSDYAKGVLAGEYAQRFIQLARAAGKPVVVDPKGRDYRRYFGATLVKPNLKELAGEFGFDPDSDEAIVAAAHELLEVCGAEYVLVTRGSAGMSLVSAHGSVLHLPAQAREVFDVSGAGDTVAATLAAGIGAGIRVEDAARLANIAAGLVVGKIGTATVDPAEIVQAIHQNELLSVHTKVVSLEMAREQVRHWRSTGLRIGFTNGCFDLLHPGHLSLLQQARARCDRLVVGLNSDASIAVLKGPGRPIQDELARSLVLASLQLVDLVVIFNESTPESLIRELRPELLVKGAEYQPAEVVGSALLEGWGGALFLAKIVEGHSTTRIVEAMASGGHRRQPT